MAFSCKHLRFSTMRWRWPLYIRFPFALLDFSSCFWTFLFTIGTHFHTENHSNCTSPHTLIQANIYSSLFTQSSPIRTCFHHPPSTIHQEERVFLSLALTPYYITYGLQIKKHKLSFYWTILGARTYIY